MTPFPVALLMRHDEFATLLLEHGAGTENIVLAIHASDQVYERI